MTDLCIEHRKDYLYNGTPGTWYYYKESCPKCKERRNKMATKKKAATKKKVAKKAKKK
jgi:hypothetical protein